MGKTGKATADTATATHTASGTAKRTTTPRKSGTSASTSSAGEQPKTTASAPKAATPDSGAAAAGTAGEQSPTARAEEVFDDAGQRVGQFALIAGQYLRQFTARAREEAEDIWVEAQNIRGKKP